MEDARKRFRDTGISSDTLDDFLNNIEKTTRLLFADYNVELQDENETIRSIQHDVLKTILDLGERLDESSIVEQFTLNQSSFSEPDSTAARSTVVFVLGQTYTSTEDPSLKRLSDAIVARNYTS